nr:MAG TPA: ERF superfamily protein [Caudoviricetes sp.]
MAETQQLNLYQKLAKITGEIGVIAKDGNNQQQKYKYIEYETIAGKFRELFSKYGVVLIPSMVEQERSAITTSRGSSGVSTVCHFEFTVVNADKPDDRFVVKWQGEAADYGDKATNKAATAAVKYYLMRQFNISSKGDEDPDSQTPEVAQKQQKPAMASVRQITAVSKLLASKGVTSGEDRKAILGAAICGKGAVLDPSKITVVKLKEVENRINNATLDQLLASIDKKPEQPAVDEFDAPVDFDNIPEF